LSGASRASSARMTDRATGWHLMLIEIRNGRSSMPNHSR
jgi:hypothetical protein